MVFVLSLQTKQRSLSTYFFVRGWDYNEAFIGSEQCRIDGTDILHCNFLSLLT